jgi:predicted MFS family arabinose efflux permease
MPSSKLNPTAPFRVALRERNLRLLLGGLAVSQVGDWLYNLALLVFVYDRTGSSTWVGIATAARIVPFVVLGPLGGVLADRVERRRLMIGSDVVRALTMLALAVTAVVHAPIALVPALAALCTAAGVAYLPATQALLPRVASADQLPAANAARSTLTHLCVVGGPLFGAIVLLLGSPASAFALNGVTFLVGAAVVAALPAEVLRLPPGATAASSRPGLIAELQTGLRALRGSAEAPALIGANVIASAVYGAFTVLFVLLSDRLGLGASGYGYLLAAGGAGGVLGAGVAHRAAACARPRRALTLAMVAVGAPVPLLAIAGSYPAAILLSAVFGAGSLVAEVVADTRLQRLLDPAVFARAYGFVVPADLAGIVAGALLAPVLVALLGLSGALGAVGAGVLAYTALALARPEDFSVVAPSGGATVDPQAEGV